MVNTLSQGAQALYFIYGGILIGICYDVLGNLRTGSWIVDAFADALFWLVAILTSAQILIYCNGLDLRFYAILLLAVGFALYKTSLSILISALFTAIINTCIHLRNSLTKLLS